MDKAKMNFKKNRKIFVFSAKLRVWICGETKLGKYAFPRKNLLIVASVAVLFLAAFAFVLSYRGGQTDPNVAIEKETQSLVGQIGKFMELPLSEQPTLATVTDRGKLKGQEFFAHAQDGDKVLIYAEAKKAILFRPSAGKIIEITKLVSGKRTETSSALPAVETSNN